MSDLRAPFPYYGGKAKWADLIWERFGAPDVYCEPFAGSLAVLLANPHPAQREVACDMDGHICNFWRAVRDDPEAVAHHADYPTIHQDLTARHKFLVRWAADNAARLSEDPRYCDAEAAGWWAWGISLWIGGGWCSPSSDSERMPHVLDRAGGGRGVSRQRINIPDQIPHMAGSSVAAGKGVSAQRVTVPDKRPHVHSGLCGQGVAKQRIHVPDQRPHIDPRTGAQGVAKQRSTIPAGPGRLIPWFEALAARLERVIVLNRDWTSALTPSVLADTRTGPGERANRCILLDPPYLTDRRKADLYQSDTQGESDQAAVAAYNWAVEHGDRYRIAYCCHSGDFDAPDGWTVETGTFGGHRENHAGTSDCIMFSPRCSHGGSLFDMMGGS